MLPSFFVRSAFTRVFSAAALFVAFAPSGAHAQDGNGGSTAAPQQPPQTVTPQRPAGLMSEPTLLTGAIDFATSKFKDSSGTKKEGFYPEFSNVVSGSGWISLGPGYRRYFADERVFFDTSAAVSWHFYNMAQARVEMPKLLDEHLKLGVQGMWQDDTQVNYFGIGPDVVDDDQSQYRFLTHEIVGYATYHVNDSFYFSGATGWLGSPKVRNAGGTFKPDFPSTLAAFPNDPAVSLAEQPSLWQSQAAVTADTRNHRGYPTEGFVYRAALTEYNDRSFGTFSFHQYEAEGLQFVPVISKKWILVFHGWAVGTGIPSGNEIPFYLLPALGGNNTLRGYHNFQFHDNNLLLANAESRLRVTEHIDAAVFADAGNVAPRFRDLNLGTTDYGVGVRLHTATTMLARVDVARGDQGWTFLFRTTDPFRLGRIRRQVANMPFMP
jgi:hypothetical protein